MELKKYELFKQGLYIETMTSTKRLHALVDKLHPIQTKFELLRIGAENDGGYLVPDDLDNIAACFSPGVDINCSFELDLFAKKQIGSHLSDYSVNQPPMNFKPLSFTKKYLGVYNDDIYITLDSWVRSQKEFLSGADLILQMDIEGDEYLSVLGVSETVLTRFRIIVIEIHHVENWGDPRFFKMVETFFNKLLKHFYVIHNHPNNCCGWVDLGGFIAPHVFELTLIRKDRCDPAGFCTMFPHVLDRPNLPKKAYLHLPIHWYHTLPTHPINKKAYLSEVTGVIHIGANQGQESDYYKKYDLYVIWVEPIPEVFQQLELNISAYEKQRAFKYLLTDCDGQSYKFNISNNAGASSSILDLARHKEIWPHVDYIKSIYLTSSTLPAMIAREGIDIKDYQTLIMDTQGSELLILKGAGELIKHFRFIKIEVPDYESYVGCCQMGEVSGYLNQLGFKEWYRSEFAKNPQIGSYFNVLYVRAT
jgi:FkbM family methyltransferase